jgi:hypothetical protein
MVDYNAMTDKQVKELFVGRFTEVYGRDQLLGWLKMAYIDPGSPEMERELVIRKLKDMEEMVNA